MVGGVLALCQHLIERLVIDIDAVQVGPCTEIDAYGYGQYSQLFDDF